MFDSNMLHENCQEKSCQKETWWYRSLKCLSTDFTLEKASISFKTVKYRLSIIFFYCSHINKMVSWRCQTWFYHFKPGSGTCSTVMLSDDFMSFVFNSYKNCIKNALLATSPAYPIPNMSLLPGTPYKRICISKDFRNILHFISQASL